MKKRHKTKGERGKREMAVGREAATVSENEEKIGRERKKEKGCEIERMRTRKSVRFRKREMEKH